MLFLQNPTKGQNWLPMFQNININKLIHRNFGWKGSEKENIFKQNHLSGGNAPKCLWSIPTNGNICSKIKAYDYCFLSFLSQFTHKQGKYDLKMAFKKQLVTSCKQAIWGEILGGNAPNYA